MIKKAALLLAAGLVCAGMTVPYAAEDETDLVIDLSDLEILSDEEGADLDIDDLLTLEYDEEDGDDGEYLDFEGESEYYLDMEDDGEDIYWYIVQYHEDEGDTIILNDAVISLPESWTGEYDMIVDGDRVRFFHTASRAAWYLDGYEGGHLFTLWISPDEDACADMPSYLELGQQSDGMYYFLIFPSDMQAYAGIDSIREGYQTLYSDIDYVKEESYGLYSLLMDDDELMDDEELMTDVSE